MLLRFQKGSLGVVLTAAVCRCRARDRTREAFAYQELSKTALGAFLCPFYGVKRLNESEYMELGSAYAGMQGPTATMDIKIGKKTWEDDASPAKVAKESKKFDEVYSQSSAMDGFRVAGMKAGALVLNSGNLKARFSLRTEEFGGWLLPAFLAGPPGFGPLPAGNAGLSKPDNQNCDIDRVAAVEMLQKIKAISAAAESGFNGTLRASSLLFTREMRLGGRWAIHLIDLAHYSQPSENVGIRDDNFCDGLRNFVQMWEMWCNDRPGQWCPPRLCCGARK